MATQLEVITGEPPLDPDAQATVTDFLDYTEYLPSDLIRSLTLIGKLDTSYFTSTDELHDLAKTYGILPNLPLNQRQNPERLRRRISHKLQYALSAREASSAEASRMYDMVDRHANRLTNIISKLNSLPKPPSRDPTPVPQLKSPQASRARPGLKGTINGTPPSRVTLRLGGPQAGASGGKSIGKPHRPRYRSRKITVPGEVLPPPNPDSPPPVTDSEWESIPPSPIPMPTSRVGVSSRSRPSKPGRISLPKPPKIPKTRVPKAARPPRPPGAMGTNVHSAVAGISTSNALSLLSPPPADAKPGTEHAPWMRLTEWEMAKLRKRMKKNAIWSPSETMIRRELSEAGRGPENYRASKAKAIATSVEFIDCDNIATTAPGKPLAPGEISADSLGLEETQLSNRGMKLNEAKKLKRENTAREQAAAEAAAQAIEAAAKAAAAAADITEIEQAAKRMGNIGSSFKSLFTKPSEGLSSTPVVSASQTTGKDMSKEKKKDKEPPKAKDRDKEKEREKEKEKEMQMEKEREKEREREREQEKTREKERLREKEVEREMEKEKEKQREKEKDEAEKKKQEMEKQEVEKEAAKTQATKRKRESTPIKPEASQLQSETVTSPVKITTKRRKIVSQPAAADHTSITTTTIVPLAAPAPSSIKRSALPPVTSAVETRGAAAKSSRPRRLSLTLKGPAPPPEPVKASSRTASRAASRRASTGPPSGRIGRDGRRQRSATPARPPTPVITAASRRSKRPAPGFVTSSQDDGPAVSVGRRKNAPRKRGSASAASAKKAAEGAASAKEKEEAARAEEEAAGEYIDPDEPRYCVCGDVSFGTMICCENTEVSTSIPVTAFILLLDSDMVGQR